MQVVADQLSAKYGKPYAQACRENAVGTVSVKLMHKLSVQVGGGLVGTRRSGIVGL